MILSIALMFAAIGTLCLLMYLCAVYALPVAVSFWAGFWALHSGAGISSIVIGIAAGALVFALGQIVHSSVRSVLIRWAVLLAFIAPAVYVGYSMVLQFSEIGIPSPVWRHIFAVIGAVAVGVSAVARLNVPPPTPRSQASSGRRYIVKSPHPRIADDDVVAEIATARVPLRKPPGA